MNGQITGFARVGRCAISMFDYASGLFRDISDFDYARCFFQDK
jgi:hypothetical protein